MWFNYNYENNKGKESVIQLEIKGIKNDDPHNPKQVYVHFFSVNRLAII